MRHLSSEDTREKRDPSKKKTGRAMAAPDLMSSLEPTRGFEPLTYALRVRCSAGLSYVGVCATRTIVITFATDFNRSRTNRPYRRPHPDAVDVGDGGGTGPANESGHRSPATSTRHVATFRAVRSSARSFVRPSAHASGGWRRNCRPCPNDRPGHPAGSCRASRTRRPLSGCGTSSVHVSWGAPVPCPS